MLHACYLLVVLPPLFTHAFSTGGGTACDGSTAYASRVVLILTSELCPQYELSRVHNTTNLLVLLLQQYSGCTAVELILFINIAIVVCLKH